jgi:hypothetical protein
MASIGSSLARLAHLGSLLPVPNLDSDYALTPAAWMRLGHYDIEVAGQGSWILHLLEGTGIFQKIAEAQGHGWPRGNCPNNLDSRRSPYNDGKGIFRGGNSIRFAGQHPSGLREAVWMKQMHIAASPHIEESHLAFLAGPEVNDHGFPYLIKLLVRP